MSASETVVRLAVDVPPSIASRIELVRAAIAAGDWKRGNLSTAAAVRELLDTGLAAQEARLGLVAAHQTGYALQRDDKPDSFDDDEDEFPENG